MSDMNRRINKKYQISIFFENEEARADMLCGYMGKAKNEQQTKLSKTSILKIKKNTECDRWAWIWGEQKE